LAQQASRQAGLAKTVSSGTTLAKIPNSRMAATKSLATPKTRKLFANRFIREEEEREILSRD